MRRSAGPGTPGRCWPPIPASTLVGLDTDADAIAESGRLLAPYGDRVTLAHAVYDQIADVLARPGVARVQGVLFDLGVSSPQLDEPGRGFAYSYDAPLDMRMDQSRAAHRGGGAQHLPGGPARPGAAGVRRGEVRAPDRGGGRAGPVRGPADVHRPAERDHPRLDPRPGPPHRGTSRPSGPSRRCGSR